MPDGVKRAGSRLPRDVLALGWVSFLTDLSSEMIFAVFAVFFTTVAGASSALLGVIEGLADLAASSLTYVAGWLSDRSGRRKAYAVAGYGFSTLAKLLLLVPTSIAGLGLFRVIERLGKGFRGPPRDAWLAAVAEPSSRGYAFGVHKALDKSGAVLGPLIAFGLLTWLGTSADTYRLLFWLAVVPAVLSIVVLSQITERPTVPHERESLRAGWHALGADFKRFLLPASLFALSYYSLGFVLVRAQVLGFGVAQTVLLYALFNVVCVIASPLVGRLGDRVGRRRVVASGYGLYALINLALLFVDRAWALVGVFVVYGVFYAIDESQSRAWVADLEPQRRGAAIGVYNAATGAAYLGASLLAGALWTMEPRAAFGLAAGTATIAACWLIAQVPGHANGSPADRRS